MERYIGLDAHAASCTLAVVSQAGRRLQDFPVETNGQAPLTGLLCLKDPTEAELAALLFSAS
jgi:hypothetical protein